jgi:hypothetical protein
LSDDEPESEPKREVEWRVTLRCPSWAVAHQLPRANASHDELSFRSGSPPRAGARVEIDVELPDGSKLVLGGECVRRWGAAEAAREGRAPGLSVRLDSTHAVDLALLAELTRAATGAAPEPRPGPAPPEQFVLTAPVSEEPAYQPPPEEPAPAAPGPPPVAAPPPAPAVAAPVAATAPRPATAAPAAGPAVLRGAAAAVGIDFGTTYTRIAVSIPGSRVHLFADDRGRTMLPSVVSYLDDGGTIAGWDARERLATAPQHTIAAPKRLLGRTIDSPEIQGMLASAGYRSERGPRDAVLLRLGDEPVAVPQVCAVVMREACRLAERQLGTRSTKAVLTMPVTFGREGEDALRRAAQLAGVEVIGLMKEPVAAALAYGFEQRTNALAAVYDFGGGTFDFSVLDFRGERFRVLASRGDAWLGGEDFDLALAEWTADEFWQRTGVQLRQRAVEWHRLLLAAEEAKRQLTVTSGAVVDVPGVVLAPRPMDLRVPVTEERLRGLCGELVDRSLDVCREGLAAANVGLRDIAQLVLTGGTSHMPLVQDAVSRFFEREVRLTVHPDVAVVQGAAIRASWLAKHGA